MFPTFKTPLKLYSYHKLRGGKTTGDIMFDCHQLWVKKSKYDIFQTERKCSQCDCKQGRNSGVFFVVSTAEQLRILYLEYTKHLLAKEIKYHTSLFLLIPCRENYLYLLIIVDPLNGHSPYLVSLSSWFTNFSLRPFMTLANTKSRWMQINEVALGLRPKVVRRLRKLFCLPKSALKYCGKPMMSQSTTLPWRL